MKQELLRLLKAHVDQSLKCHKTAMEEKDAYCAILHSIRVSAYQALIEELGKLKNG